MDKSDTTDETVLEAETVYLLMKKGFPISRNVRAQWMLQHLDTCVRIQEPSSQTNEDAPDLEIISILPKNRVPSWSEENSWKFSYRILSSTSIVYLAHKYRMVFNLDLSPSLATVDIQHGEIVTDEVSLATKQCLENITKPFIVPGSKRVMKPEMYVTVIAHTPFFTNPAQQVLVQGWLLTVDNINCLMEFIEKKLHVIEEKVASITGLINHQLEVVRAQNDRLVGGLFEESAVNAAKSNSQNNVSMVLPETCFINILRYGLMALSVLPEYSCAHLVIVTDGIIGVTDVHVLDSVVQQLRAKTVACSFLHVGSSYHPDCANGLVPNQDLLFFLVSATLGSYIKFSPDTKFQDTGDQMNDYHQNFLCWRLDRRVPFVDQRNASDWHTNNFLFYGYEPPPLLRKKQIDSEVSCTLSSLICCRLREGYLIKTAQIHDGFLEICFKLPWKNHVFIEYLVTIPWMIKSLSVCNTVRYTITTEAPYEFLHDITCLSKKPLKSQYRQSVVSKFWSVLTCLTESDTMLSHFSWFPGMNWSWYNVPDTIKSGMPLFYLPGSSPSTIQLSDVACPQFGQIWQPVVCLEPHQWARWMHSQRITLIFAHDRPLPKHLHLANQSGRFQCVQSRQAAAMLYAMLKNWATFVLVENHMYISFIYKQQDKPPVSFCLINVNCKSLCVVLNVAFAGGTEGVLRHNVMTDLLDRLSKLTFPNRAVTEQRETACCTIVHKALEKFLIKYDRVPSDLNTITYPDGSQFLNRSASSIVYTNLTTLSRYLHHSRWLWMIKKPSVLTVPRVQLSKLNIAAIARILSTITKTRVAEGFIFAHSSAGIINMVLEVQVHNPANEKLSPCIIQYILFPTHVIHSNAERDSVSENDTDEDAECGMDDMESSGDFEIVTEIWVEPQCGFVQMPPTHKASYMNGFQFEQISHVISRVDKQCIDALLTLEHLSLMSSVDNDDRSNDSVACVQFQDSPTGQSSYGGSKKSANRAIKADFSDHPILDDRIQPMPFVFDIINVLPKCQQAELLFSMFDDGVNVTEYMLGSSANNILIDGLLDRIKYFHSRELILNSEESQKFTEMLLNRSRVNATRELTVITEKDDVDCGPVHPHWKCFIKGISVTHVIVTILPSSEADVQLLKYTRTNETNCESETVDEDEKYGLILPIYVYDCSLSVLIDAQIDKLESPRAKDIFRDHTFKIGEQPQEEFISLKPGDEIKLSSPEPKSEESDNVPNDQLNLMEHCKTLSLAHCNAYVISVYKSLILENPLSYEDMEAAVNQCEEAPFEINITSYLRSVCKHLNKYKEDDEQGDSTTCDQMEPLHDLIEEKFKRIMNVAFRHVSTFPELYYYVPPWNSDNSRILRSRQSICNESFGIYGFYPTGDDRNLINSTAVNKTCDESKLSSCPSAESFSNELDENVDYGNNHPLFLQLVCSIHAKSKFSNVSVKVLPTCFANIVDNLEALNSPDVKITLDIIRLNLPKDVLQVEAETTVAGLRTTSYCSSSPIGSVHTENEHSQLNKTQSTEMEQLQDEINHLPPYQMRAILSLIEEIEWLLEDETATALLDQKNPTEETLKFVSKHVSESTEKSSCCMDKVPLHFVFPLEISGPIFLEELKKLTVDKYCVKQEGNLFYCIKNLDYSVPQADHLEEQSDRDNTNFPVRNNESSMDEMSGGHSEVSSIGQEHENESEDGYDGDSSTADDDCQWLINLDKRRELLPNFWLILLVEDNQVDIYFHCRFLEIASPEVVRYQQVEKLVVSKIKEICVRVNQYLLLRDLHDKRICDNLLEEPTSSEPVTEVWRAESSESAGDQSKNLIPGMFRCPIVWEWPFCLHPRLKTGPGRCGISRGITALHGVLNRFSVNNRTNMFVYQQNNGNVFYLRLHEQTSDLNKSLQSKLSESDEKLVVSRSSSTASLSQSKGQPIDQVSLTDSRPRVRSFGEKESDILNKSEDSIVLMVHGISDAGVEIKHELVQVLQNRLDDAVLEVLSVMLARNPMCKLSPSDVHFIQKPYKSAETVIRLSVQDRCLSHLAALKYYLHQNILQFLYIPKYTDPRTHYHFQDYSQPEGSRKRVPESDIFLYNQSPSCGNKGIACIAMGIVDSKGNLIAPDNADAETEFFEEYPRVCDFQSILQTRFDDESDRDVEAQALIEFKIWKQGRVNLESLKDKLQAAVRHSIWDLLTEYAFLPISLTDEQNNQLRPVYQHTLAYWLQYGLEIAVPAVKKHVVTFEQTHALSVTIREVQNLIQIHAPDAAVRTFVHQKRQPFYDSCCDLELLLKRSNDLNETSNFGWLEHASRLEDKSTTTYQIGVDEKQFSVDSILVARNNNQWTNVNSVSNITDAGNVKDQKLSQKFNPLLLEGSFVPRQRFFLAKISRNHIIMYAYNWSKEKHEKLMKSVTNLGSWLNTRSSFYSNISMQKLGIFHHPRYSPDNDKHKINDLEHLIKFPQTDKDSQRSAVRGAFSTTKTQPSWQRVTDQAMRDVNLKDHHTVQSSDKVVQAISEFQLIKHNKKRAKDDLERLHAMWQSRNTVSNVPLCQQTLESFKQRARLLHYCFTPILFLPSWRLQSAATRDASIVPSSNQRFIRNRHYSINKTPVNTEWHKEVCNAMITEYKQYLQTLGFNSVHVDYNKKEDEDDSNETFYLQKSMLGGIFLFCIQLFEPFFSVKLKVIESSRLQHKSSSALVNQFIVSFMDSCDKIKVNMHLHSFTYDFHLRCIHSYIAGTGQWSLQHGYHLTHFLDDFTKYYSKAPNYARNLAYSGVVKISDLAVSANTLFNYLLSHQKMYGMQVFSMMSESNIADDSEYVLVKLQSTPLVSYCDAQNSKCVDDLDVALIVSYLNEPFASTQEITLKYYLVLSSRRDHYPKREVENKLGKYRTVYSVVKSVANSQIGSPSESSPLLSSLLKKCDKEQNTPLSTPPSSSSSSNVATRDDEEEKEEDLSLAPTPPPVPDSPLAQNVLSHAPSTSNLVHIRQESVNYFGYYSSHEQLMQQLIMSQANAAQQHITHMIQKGALHCRTHLLWNKLLESRSSMIYAEFAELKSLALVEPLVNVDSRLRMFVNQPISWYQGLAKILQNRYQEYHKQFNAPDGTVTHHLILHPSYVQAFMMLTIDLHASRGELFVVYRKAAEILDAPFSMTDVYSLIEGFVNACCFHLWVGMLN